MVIKIFTINFRMRLFLTLSLGFIYLVAYSKNNTDNTAGKSIRSKVGSMTKARSQKPQSKLSSIITVSQAPDFTASLMDGKNHLL